MTYTVLDDGVMRDAYPDEIAEIEAASNRPPTEAEYVAAIDAMLNEGANRKKYDTIYTASLRAGYPGPFHEEGVAYATWMDDVYHTGNVIMAEVLSGQRPFPTIPELLALMPECPYVADIDSTGSTD